jgi:hypothetical protein
VKAESREQRAVYEILVELKEEGKRLKAKKVLSLLPSAFCL